MAGRLQFDALVIEKNAQGESVVEELIRDGFEIIFDRRSKPGEEDEDDPTIQIQKIIYISCHKDINTPSTDDTSQIEEFFKTTQLSSITLMVGSVDMSTTWGLGSGAAGGRGETYYDKRFVTYDFLDPENKWKIEQLRVQDNNNNTSRISYSLSFTDAWKDEV